MTVRAKSTFPLEAFLSQYNTIIYMLCVPNFFPKTLTVASKKNNISNFQYMSISKIFTNQCTIYGRFQK